jgi:DNA-binding GntR family transcriptional regulator
MKDPAHDGNKEEQQVEIDEADPRLYVKLAAGVRARIQAGELAVGRPVPSIGSLQQETGCSRQTCGKALRLLERQGLLQRIPGLGYHVASQPQTPGTQAAAVADLTVISQVQQVKRPE